LALEQGVEKYGSAGLLASSANRGWTGLSAELRCHSEGSIAWTNRHLDVEMCVDAHGSRAAITRRGGGIVDRAMARRGTIWLTPPGLDGDVVDISSPLPEILHVFLAPDCFSPTALGIAIDPMLIRSLRYERAFHDPLLAEIGYAIAAELRQQTAGGRVLVETLATSLAARLVQIHCGGSAVQAEPPSTRRGLDRHRLARVLDFIEDNLEGDLTINRLASIACLSRFHFARAFKAAMGQPPHRYVGDRRLERAKALLAEAERPLADIALALGFSCQASFTRAFRAATSGTPGQYRRQASL
jgi:AraC family transcriptional regulator